MILLFSHQLTHEQVVDAQNMGVTEFISMPTDLKQKWGNVPATLHSLSHYAEDFWAWVGSVAQENDYALIQGDMGMVVMGVERLWEIKVIPVYATTQRLVSETLQLDGSVVKTSEFKHVMFRQY